MTTASNSAILDPVTNPVLTVAPQNKEDTTMSGATNKITEMCIRDSPYTPIKSSFEDAGSVEDMMRCSKL